jgi:hypothetical protein
MYSLQHERKQSTKADTGIQTAEEKSFMTPDEKVGRLHPQRLGAGN